MKGLRTIASLPSTGSRVSTHSSASSASDIIHIENPEKRLSIRPHTITMPNMPLPRCSEGSEENLDEESEENDSRYRISEECACHLLVNHLSSFLYFHFN